MKTPHRAPVGAAISAVSRILRRHWPFIAGTIMLAGLGLAYERGLRQRDELAELRREIQTLHGLIEQFVQRERRPPGKRHDDGRIMFAVTRKGHAAYPLT